MENKMSTYDMLQFALIHMVNGFVSSYAKFKEEDKQMGIMGMILMIASFITELDLIEEKVSSSEQALSRLADMTSKLTTFLNALKASPTVGLLIGVTLILSLLDKMKKEVALSALLTQPASVENKE